MHSMDDFLTNLASLCDLDHDIDSILGMEEINSEEITHLVDKREQILLTLISTIEQHQEFAELQEWQMAVQRTQLTITLMQKKTAELGHHLQKYRYGNKSVQQYKKFL
ncbi:flagellar protein FliT [Vibrio ostreicida]|uniref:Flagellar protein FliT n=1 Tax=Vibrio ostreicida TaxID=526588 RepID=A0ABT8BWM5_9VIBR|nr:flagellar protein FliT [Vibrio ostreicida]MDN3610675.1 flagellar protein FliT [Vibrio ostreicida]MDN3611202.1 flagellar protein FliT [Vibrio ostreicida]NPD07327.1 flagellar protein FliT [Vibrio ostreicida]